MDDISEIGIALLVLRVVVGLTLAAHGAQKLVGWWNGPGLDGFSGWIGSMGMRSPRAAATMAAIFEFVGGLLFALGFLTPLAALMIAIVMLVAIATVHWSSGFFNSDGGYEFNLALVAVAIAVAISGPGRYSLDQALELTDPAFRGVEVGLIVLLLAVVATFANLALRTRTPGNDTTHTDATPDV